MLRRRLTILAAGGALAALAGLAAASPAMASTAAPAAPVHAAVVSQPAQCEMSAGCVLHNNHSTIEYALSTNANTPLEGNPIGGETFTFTDLDSGWGHLTGSWGCWNEVSTSEIVESSCQPVTDHHELFYFTPVSGHPGYWAIWNYQLTTSYVVTCSGTLADLGFSTSVNADSDWEAAAP